MPTPTTAEALCASLAARADLQAASTLAAEAHAEEARVAAAHGALAAALVAVDRPGGAWRLAVAAVHLAWHAARLCR